LASLAPGFTDICMIFCPMAAALALQGAVAA